MANSSGTVCLAPELVFSRLSDKRFNVLKEEEPDWTEEVRYSKVLVDSCFPLLAVDGETSVSVCRYHGWN